MDWSILLKLLTVFEIFHLSQSSYVQHAKQRIRQEVGEIIDDAARQYSAEIRPHKYEHFQKSSTGRRVHRVYGRHRNRWSSGHRKSMEHHHFTGWSAWSICNDECVKRRERYCKLKRKCGFTKHVEERKCLHCHPTYEWQHQRKHKNSFQEYQINQQQNQQQQQTINHGGSPPQAIIINAAAVAPSSSAIHELPTKQPTVQPLHDTIVQHEIRLPLRQENVELHHHHQHDHRHYHLQHGNDELNYHQNEDGQERDEDGKGDEDGDGEEEQPQTEHDVQQGYYESENYDNYEDHLTSSLSNTIENINHNDYDEPEDDYFILKTTKPHYRKQRNQMPTMLQSDEYYDLENDNQYDGSIIHDDIDSPHFGTSHSIKGYQRKRTKQKRKPLQQHQHQQQQHQQQQEPKQHLRKPRMRNLSPNITPADDGIEGDIFQYEDFDFEPTVPNIGNGETNYAYDRQKFDGQSSDSYEDNDYDDVFMVKNSTFLVPSKEKATPDALIPRHRRLYSKWSRWTKCSPKCTARRYKKCRVREQCGREVLREITYCYTEGSFCQQWLQAQMQKSSPYELRPLAASRRRDISVDGGGVQSNSIVSDYIMNSKGYRGPEYAPMKLKCGIAPMRSGKRSMYNMLKIIGGKASRKGEWPWQVAIFNRFKEAFCGGTLIAPQWILTAAHCVRKVLYVRLGEHNLDYEDGTEMQLRILKSFKHPNFDKKTVDSDVALLKLPKSINTTTWIGFSCLPRPYQPLPKNLDCTVIGWGKRRNRDAAGTSVLHQAEVPIISMDNCRSVYQDYTITKNMFCAGHKRGRVDTCAGDSGGPLLCRDTTKPNHPWTIFGITSFGDGCAKRNKFGIYAKVPNYVDWVWSVINCNGNCKLHQRNYG